MTPAMRRDYSPQALLAVVGFRPYARFEERTRMSIFQAVFLFAAAFGAGAINAVAGGGSLLSFPALLVFGYASKTANVTNTVALWPGLVGGSLGYRQELGGQRRRILVLAPPAILGALTGSAILLSTPQAAFDSVVAILILFACGLMAVQDHLGTWATRHRLSSRHPSHVPLALIVGVFATAVYGAYFGAGIGILMLAMLSIFMPDDIQRSNALRVMLALLINGSGVVYFAAFGPVRWAPAGVMAVGAVLGGYLGVGVARRLGRRWLRLAVITCGVGVAAVLLAR